MSADAEAESQDFALGDPDHGLANEETADLTIVKDIMHAENIRSTRSTRSFTVNGLQRRSDRALNANREAIMKKITLKPRLQEWQAGGKPLLVPLYARKALANVREVHAPQVFIFEILRTMFGLGFVMRQGNNRGDPNDPDAQPSRVRISQVFTDNRAPIIKNTTIRAENLLQVGDVVLQIGDCPIEQLDEANSAVYECQIGSHVLVHIMRGGFRTPKPGRDSEENMLARAHAQRRKQTVIEKNKLEEEKLRQYHQDRFDRRLEALVIAQKSEILHTFVETCTELFSSPEVDLMSMLRDTFVGSGIEYASEENTVELFLDFVDLQSTVPLQTYALMRTLSRHVNDILRCVQLTLNFGWRPLDRLSLQGFSIVRGLDKKQCIRVEGEEVSTRADSGLDKPCLYGKPFARILQATLPMVARLSQVTLSNSAFDDTCTEELVKALRGCACLRSLDLSQNMLGPSFAKQFADALNDENLGLRLTVEVLNLSWNELGGEGAEILLSRLSAAKASALTELSLAFNGITDRCGPALRKILEEESPLQGLNKLVLANNRFTKAIGTHLIPGIRANSTLVDFSLSFNPLGLETSMALIACVRESENLALFYLENTISDDSPSSTAPSEFPNADGEKSLTFCDGLIQFIWELKEHMNILRLQLHGFEIIEVHLEYPPRLRHLVGTIKCYEPYLGLSKAVAAEELTAQSSHLDLSASIFHDRVKEADSYAFFDTIIVAQTAMYTDWQFMEPKLIRFIKDEKDITEIRAVVSENYFELSNVHRYYAAMGNDHDCIGFNEFMDIVFECRISDSGCPDNVAQGAFIAANVELKAETKEAQMAMNENPDNALCLYEFVEALIRLAMRKFFDKKSLRSAPTRKDAFEWLLLENIFPFGKRMTSNCFRRDKLFYYDIVTVLTTYKLKIDKLWRTYAGVTGANLLMKKDHWLDMINSTGVSRASLSALARKKGGDISRSIFNPLVIKLAFWSAQTLERNKLVRNVRDRARNMSAALSYTEFLEGIVYLADAIGHPIVVEDVGLPADAYLSEKLICVLEMLLGAAPQDCFKKASYPSLLTGLREKHQAMQYPERDDYLFEAKPGNIGVSQPFQIDSAMLNRSDDETEKTPGEEQNSEGNLNEP